MKKHTRRTVRDPFGWINKTLPIAQDQQRDIGIAYHASLQAMLNGYGSEQAWGTIACALNVSLMLSEQGFCAGAIETIKIGQEALMCTKARADRLNKWGFDGEGARLVMASCNILDEQISRTTRAQLAEALREVHRRIEADEVFTTTTPELETA